jgi:hypothetical protein
MAHHVLSISLRRMQGQPSVLQEWYRANGRDALYGNKALFLNCSHIIVVELNCPLKVLRHGFIPAHTRQHRMDLHLQWNSRSRRIPTGKGYLYRFDSRTKTKKKEGRVRAMPVSFPDTQKPTGKAHERRSLASPTIEREHKHSSNNSEQQYMKGKREHEPVL